ncbi:unnamed protein product, partial [Discosporangium mesarthrocarpum]
DYGGWVRESPKPPPKPLSPHSKASSPKASAERVYAPPQQMPKMDQGSSSGLEGIFSSLPPPPSTMKPTSMGGGGGGGASFASAEGLSTRTTATPDPLVMPASFPLPPQPKASLLGGGMSRGLGPTNTPDDASLLSAFGGMSMGAKKKPEVEKTCPLAGLATGQSPGAAGSASENLATKAASPGGSERSWMRGNPPGVPPLGSLQTLASSAVPSGAARVGSIGEGSQLGAGPRGRGAAVPSLPLGMNSPPGHSTASQPDLGAGGRTVLPGNSFSRQAAFPANFSSVGTGESNSSALGSSLNSMFGHVSPAPPQPQVHPLGVGSQFTGVSGEGIGPRLQGGGGSIQDQLAKTQNEIAQLTRE